MSDNEQFPRGKLNATDEGELEIRVGVENNTVVVVFNKPVAWIGFGYHEAKAFTENIMKHAEKIKQ